MMTLILPETDDEIKTVDGERLDPASGSIVLRFNSSGKFNAEILTDQSDEEEIFRQHLRNAGSVIKQLQSLFTVEQPSRIR